MLKLTTKCIISVLSSELRIMADKEASGYKKTSAEDLAGIEVTSVDELKKYIGQETNIGQWVLITQEKVNAFADVTGDHQFIHVDPERAKDTFFRGTVAHGFFTLSMLAGFLQQDLTGLKINLGGKMGVNIGLDEVRFLAPVKVGKQIRLHRQLIGVEESPDKRWVQITNKASIEIEGSEKIAMTAKTLSRTYF